VPELLEVRGPQPSGQDEVDHLAIGSWLSDAEVWLGLVRDVLQLAPQGSIVLESLDELALMLDEDRLVSATSDGHVVVLGPRAVDVAME
jgi:hypothetical protein